MPALPDLSFLRDLVMPGRHRVRDSRSLVIGDCIREDGSLIAWDSASIGKYEVCDDFVGNPTGDNVFQLDVQQGDRWLLNGTDVHPVTGGIRIYRGMPITGGWLVPPSLGNIAPALTTLELSNLAWKVLADSNPNQPHVSLPTVAGELRDLPSLVKDWGGGLLRKAAKGHLSWRWAIKPMMGDLRKMFQFQKAVEERLKWLKRLKEGKELKRRTGLGTFHEKGDWTPYVLHSKSGVQIYGKRREVHSVKQWGTVRYRLSDDAVLPELPEGLESLANRLAKGLTSHEALATAWELLPWSWLADWFIGLGDTIAAINNTVPVTHSSVCIMRTSDSYYEYAIDEERFRRLVSQKGQIVLRTRKERRIALPILPFQIRFPLLDAGKWSILGSLAALRRR